MRPTPPGSTAATDGRTVGDVPLHTTVHGDGDDDRETLVFVHGGWLSGAMWGPQVEHFVDDYRVVTVDLRGHGATGATSERDYSVELFADDLRRCLDTLDVDRPVLCGLSLGGLVAQTYAAQTPDDLAGLVLADTVESLPPVPMTQLQKQFLFPKVSIYPTFRLLGSGASFRMLLQSVRAVEGASWLALDDDVREYALAEVDRFPIEEFIKVFDALYDADPQNVDDITAPTLLLYGDHEANAVVAQNRYLARTIPDTTTTVVPDAGHLSNLDNTDVFNATVEQFLRRIGA
jgi:pimeloyl-ACP methyl ester carboxylesterase